MSHMCRRVTLDVTILRKLGMPHDLLMVLELSKKSTTAYGPLNSQGSFLNPDYQVEDPGTPEASHRGACEHSFRRQKGQGNPVTSHPNQNTTSN